MPMQCGARCADLVGDGTSGAPPHRLDPLGGEAGRNRFPQRTVLSGRRGLPQATDAGPERALGDQLVGDAASEEHRVRGAALAREGLGLGRGGSLAEGADVEGHRWRRAEPSEQASSRGRGAPPALHGLQPRIAPGAAAELPSGRGAGAGGERLAGGQGVGSADHPGARVGGELEGDHEDADGRPVPCGPVRGAAPLGGPRGRHRGGGGGGGGGGGPLPSSSQPPSVVPEMLGRSFQAAAARAGSALELAVKGGEGFMFSQQKHK
mmetsp:Transcript_43583/g.113157  ORF Transcript_43583/g.113157 Transcript_43583/m.113157 type:complete len:265 (+) Transcript_43583:444-1238(+)